MTLIFQRRNPAIYIPGGGAAPGAIAEVLLVNQGGASNNLTNSQGLAWSAPSAGSNPLSYYRVYANGVKVSTDGVVTGTSFTHSSATNANAPTLDAAATAFYYQVSAVDTQGNEGALSTQFTCYGYQGSNGGSTWGNADFSFGAGLTEDYADTTGSPVGGGVDLKLGFPAGVGAGWQPTSGAPQVPQYDLEVGGMTSGGGGYCRFDVKPMTGGNTFAFGLISRFPFGDIFNFKGPSDISVYGALTTGAWNTVSIPLPDCSIGTSTFTASIGSPYGSDANGAWATMVVTALQSGVGVDYGGFVTSGAPAGTRIGIQGVTGNGSSVASWQVQGPGITGSTVVSSQTMTCQRTNVYKPAFFVNGGNPGGTVYINNLRFQRQ